MGEKLYVDSWGRCFSEELAREIFRPEGEDSGEDIWDPGDSVTEEEIAREQGFWIDDDGHWVPVEDEDEW